ncbi:CBS domain-containing protein [Candidatus Fermentibacteria bacterium]|nr:CBS domain-containing protein [Candidatus Fermentibacteria bacterium]
MLPNPRLSQIMDGNPPVVDRHERLSAVLRLFQERHVRHVPVCDGRRLIGLLSDRELRRYSLSAVFQDRPNVNAVFLDQVVRLDDVCRNDYVALSPSATLLDALEAMESTKHYCVPVVDDIYNLLGVVTVRDTLTYVADVPRSRDQFGRPQKTAIARKRISVSDVMTQEPTTIDVSASLSDALALMEKGGFRHLPVMTNGNPVGLLSQYDILRFTYSATFGVSQDEQRQFLDDFVDIEGVMSPGIPHISPSAQIAEAAQRLLDEPTGALLILTNGGRRLAGILTERDFVMLLRRELHDYWTPEHTPQLHAHHGA